MNSLYKTTPYHIIQAMHFQRNTGVRPIDSQLREWWSIAGSWVSAPDNLFAPYNDAPESAHILWTRPIGDTMGGFIGGDRGDQWHDWNWRCI